MVPHGVHPVLCGAADPDRDHGHVRPAVRADDATCGEHDGRPHRRSSPILSMMFIMAEIGPERGGRPRHGPGRRCRWRSASRCSKRSSSCRFRHTSSHCSRPCSSAWPFTLITESVRAPRPLTLRRREENGRELLQLRTWAPRSALASLSSARASASAGWPRARPKRSAVSRARRRRLPAPCNLPLFLSKAWRSSPRSFALLVVLLK